VSTTTATGTAERAEPSPQLKARNEKVEREYQRRRAARAPSPEERKAERTATDFYEVLGSEEAPGNPGRTTIDTASFCELMSEAAIAQTIRYAKVSSGIDQEWNCEAAVELLVLRAKGGGFEDVSKAEVIGVNAKGERATATVRFGNGSVTSLPLVKEDGEWKLAASSVPGGR
jgi:hypothetical protein